jgi:tetratricopeptide (TPR) repeat protein
LADTYNNIGIVHRAKAEYDKALEFYHKSLAIDLVKLGKDHPSVALTYYNMAIAYGAKKNVIKKKELLRKAYAIQLKKLGKDHPDTKKTRAALFGP